MGICNFFLVVFQPLESLQLLFLNLLVLAHQPLFFLLLFLALSGRVSGSRQVGFGQVFPQTGVVTEEPAEIQVLVNSYGIKWDKSSVRVEMKIRKQTSFLIWCNPFDLNIDQCVFTKKI